jgi:hypothetical protein
MKKVVLWLNGLSNILFLLVRKELLIGITMNFIIPKTMKMKGIKWNCGCPLTLCLGFSSPCRKNIRQSFLRALRNALIESPRENIDTSVILVKYISGYDTIKFISGMAVITPAKSIKISR